MGFRVQLIAVSGKELAEVHRDYGVVPTGRYEDVPDSPVLGARLPSGAYLLFINDEIEPDDRIYARLSRGATLVACYANETVMSSYACGWADGGERWHVLHDFQQDANHLKVSGSAPSELPAIRNRLFRQQAGVTDTDYVFDVPVELFVALGGVRYDQDIPGAGPNPWEILERTR
jgi:hypothetical protein